MSNRKDNRARTAHSSAELCPQPGDEFGSDNDIDIKAFDWAENHPHQIILNPGLDRRSSHGVLLGLFVTATAVVVNDNVDVMG